MGNLEIVPIDLAEAKVFINTHHRHHIAPVGHKFSLGLSDGEQIVGVATIGRPVSRHLDDGFTLEVNRLCVLDGIKNGCSKLYSAAWRVTKNLGYKKLITYILDSEPGTSLYASGWRMVATNNGGSWSVKSRPRVDKHPIQGKMRFEIEAHKSEGDSK